MYIRGKIKAKIGKERNGRERETRKVMKGNEMSEEEGKI